MMRAIAVCASAVLALAVLAGCEEDHMFAPCSFDDKILAACQMDNELSCTNYSCAVAEHPACVDLTCLSFEGATPRCTRACDPQADDCPGGSKCTRYAIQDGLEQHACVKIVDQEKELFQSCDTDPNLCQGIDADQVCMPIDNLGSQCTHRCGNPCGAGTTCDEYNNAFYCLKSCTGGAGLCDLATERCIEYRSKAYCLPLCSDGAADGCAQHGEFYYRLPDADLACDAHEGCPGRSFCTNYNDQGFFCLPCEFATGLY
jgi:hypothetical protein